MAYTSTEQIGEHENKNGSLNILGRYGTTSRVNLASYEERVNPDRRTAYWVHNPSTCAKEALEAATGEPASYQGLKDSHPYSVTAYDGRSWLVADAGGNDLLKVDRKGRISTVAVLPAQPLKITAAMASALELPDCVVGVTYKFEAVPTDVEVGGDGKVYVSTLAGGPESPVLGARSSVYQVNPRNGHVRRVATGFSGATNIALYRGKIYVAEFYAGRVSVIKDGRVQQTFPLHGVVSIESGRGHLYAGTFPSDSGPGSVVELTKRAGS